MAELDDAFHKFERGQKHLSNFYQSISQNLKTDRAVFEINAEPYQKPTTDPRKYWKLYTLYVTHLPAISKQDGILLGEVIQSFRSSLDYLAWALVAKHSKRLTQSQMRKVQFPMSPSRRHFQAEIGRMLPNVPIEHRAFFERYQPYKRSMNGITMRYFRILSNTDKHRIILPALHFPEYNEGNINCEGGEIIKFDFHLKQGREIKSGAKIMTILLAGDVLKQHVHIDTNLSIIPMFPKFLTRPYFPDPVVLIEPTLNHIRDICLEILTEAKKFF